MNFKEQFINIYTSNIQREGAEDLLKYLESSSFFEDPASTRYHLDRPEGLVEHSIDVYNRLHWLCAVESSHNSKFTKPTEESIAIVGLLHDLCKANTYVKEIKNFKNYDTDAIANAYDAVVRQDSHGEYIWDSKIGYRKEDNFIYGHGEKSVYLISKFMKLTDEEAFAIRYHMASWNEHEKDDASRCFSRYEFAMLTHMADEFATFVDEV